MTFDAADMFAGFESTYSGRLRTAIMKREREERVVHRTPVSMWNPIE